MILHGERLELSEKVAQLIAEEINSVLGKKNQVVLAVPGGSSVADIFSVLQSSELEWQRVHIFLLDERLMPLDHPDSNYRLLNRCFGGQDGGVQLHPFRYSDSDPGAALVAYKNELDDCGGRFDIVLASSGEDGHIGSIFPDHPSTMTDDEYFIFIDDSPKPPASRMSAGPALISRSGLGIVLFFGPGKALALKKCLDRKQTVFHCPARLIAGLKRHYIVTDQEVETG